LVVSAANITNTKMHLQTDVSFGCASRQLWNKQLIDMLILYMWIVLAFKCHSWSSNSPQLGFMSKLTGTVFLFVRHSVCFVFVGVLLQWFGASVCG